MKARLAITSLRSAVDVLSSLRLTVVLLGLSMILVFAATLAQVELGLHEVQRLYLRSWMGWFDPIPGKMHISLPFPGGMLLGSLLILNLLAAHTRRFQLRWKKTGLILIHVGIILLLLGELFTAVLTKESQMTLDEGQTLNYSTSPREVELVVMDVSQNGEHLVTAIPQSRLRDGARFDLDGFSLRVVRFFRNSEIAAEESVGPGFHPMRADRGAGMSLAVREVPVETAMDRRDLSSAFVEIVARNGSSQGRWLLSNGIPAEQELMIDGRSWKMSIRQQRLYHPFSIRLLDFSHDRYLGTDIPMNFSSRIRLMNSGTGEDREALIYMNHPLRYQGLTFYQSGFANDDRTSIFQVVRNPVWTMPYVACSMVGAGLLWVFSQHLIKAVGRRRSSTAP